VKNDLREFDDWSTWVLKTCYPNPDRLGCPSQEFLRGLARHEISVEKTEAWSEHLGTCSECFNDYTRFSAVEQKRRRRFFTLGSVAAVLAAMLLIVACLSFLYLRGRSLGVETAIIDLRPFSLTRGDDTGSGTGQGIEINHRVSRLTIMLPVGSRDGQYEVGILRTSGEEVVKAPASTKIAKDQSISLITEMELSKLELGPYLLAWRRAGFPWSYHPVRLK